LIEGGSRPTIVDLWNTDTSKLEHLLREEKGIEVRIRKMA